MNRAGVAADDRPALKSGCRFRQESLGGRECEILENPTDGTFFRCGKDEAAFLRSLDGTRSVQQIVTESTSGIDPRGRAELLARAAQAGLVAGFERPSPPPAPPNPLFLKFSLGNPERFFDLLHRWTNPVFSPAGAALALALLVVAAWSICSDLPAFLRSLGSVFSTANAPALVVIYLLLKFVHETAHGLVSHRLGSHIPDWGLCLVFFFPLTYVDATSAWRIDSRMGRIAVSAAGMIAEILVAAVAAVVWSLSDEGLVQTLCANAIVLATVTTVAFNANPLMRYDGYFIVADLAGIPNLYGKASQAAWGAIQTWCFGFDAPRGPWTLTAYGLACLAWRVVVLGGICLSAVAIFHGIGVVFAGLALLAAAVPLTGQVRRFFAARQQSQQQWKWHRPAIACVLMGVILFVPLIPLAPIPGLVVFRVFEPVRAICPGFLDEVLVRDGQQVAKDQVLFRLSNPEESARLGQLRAAAKRAEMLALEYARAQRHDLQSRQEAIARGLNEQIHEVAGLLANLELRSPCDGQIVGPRINDLTDSFLRAGREVSTVAQLDSVEILAAVPEERLSQISLSAGLRAEISVPGRNLRTWGAVSQFEKSATREMRKESLAAPAGGPFAVRASSQPENLELVDPVVYFRVVPEAKADGWREGEPALIRIPGAGRSSIARAVSNALTRFWDRASESFQEGSVPQ